MKINHVLGDWKIAPDFFPVHHVLTSVFFVQHKKYKNFLPELKSHYAIVIEQGTMEAFRVVQYLDYGLMLSTGLFFFILALIIARQHKEGSFFRIC